jgi:tyrosinase
MAKSVQFSLFPASRESQRKEASMKLDNPSRRSFVMRSALALGAAALPTRYAMAQSSANRLDWQSFKSTSSYGSFLNAVSAMKANTNSADPNSWAYWTNVHVNYCPHHISYFLAWHRGYLYYFEQRLRMVSRDNSLVLPYWDYYSNANIPAEFTNRSSVLYMRRKGTNVYNALTLAPFASNITNFPRGMSNAYEPTLEGGPHDPVHNIIGGAMATMQSPNDPIFWLHHANIDRLWVAWVAAGGGRTMPARTNSYWGGSFTYSSTLTMARNYTYDTTTNLAYTYQNTRMPSSLPPIAQGPRLTRVQFTGNQGAPALPPQASTSPGVTGKLGNGRFSISAARGLSLDERSVSVQLPLAASGSAAVQAIAQGNTATVTGSTDQYRSVILVLDNLQLLGAGQDGGYFYRIYLNLPAAGDSATSAERYQIAGVGPFEIAGAGHHGGTATLRFPITDYVAGLSTSQLSALTVSFVRVNGGDSPAGPVIGVGEVRIELSTEDVHS